MSRQFSVLAALLLLLGCSQIEVPEGEPDRNTPASTSSKNNPGEKTRSTSISTRQEYKKAYNLFKVHHRNIFDLVNENRLALKNAGDKAVEAAEDMFSLVTDRERSNLEDVLDRYRNTWSGFDLKSPSVGERTRLKSAGKALRKEFNPDAVQLKSSRSVAERSPSKSSNEQREKPEGSGLIKRDSSGNRSVDVNNPERYRRLFKQWREAHQRFKNGLESSDPLLESSFNDLKTALRKMVEEVRTDKDKLINYYLSQYQLIYERRDEFKGTPAKTDHLTFLQKQFTREFAPSTSG